MLNVHREDGMVLMRAVDAAGLPISANVGNVTKTSRAVAVIDEEGAATYEFDIGWNPTAFDVDGFGHVRPGSYSAPAGTGREQDAQGR